MVTRSVLVGLPSYPFAMQALMPNHLLALLAGSLSDAGHETQVWDYGTFETLDRVMPKRLRSSAQFLADGLLGERASNSFSLFSVFRRLREMGRELDSHQGRFCADVARDLASVQSLDFVVFAVDTPEDLRNAVLVAGQLRELAPSVKRVAAGTFIERYWDTLARLTDVFDVLALDDAATWLQRWAECLDDADLWADLPNLAFVRGKRVVTSGRSLRGDLAASALPLYSLDAYPAVHSGSKLALFQVECGRGCFRGCTACPEAFSEGRPVRAKSTRMVCDEIAHMVRHQKAYAFDLSGVAHFGAQGVSLACEILKRGLRVRYSQTGTVTDTVPSLLSTLKAAGNDVISYRIDTGSQWLLDDYYRRGFSVSQAEKLLRASRAAGMLVVARFAYPCPADDYHTEAETLRFIGRTKPNAALIELPEVVPGSSWFDRPGEFGFRLDPVSYVRAALCARRTALPLRSWRSQVYRTASRTFASALRDHNRMTNIIDVDGVSTLLTPQLALVARICKYEGHEEGFAALWRRQLLTGDVDAVAAMVRRFNEHAAAGRAASLTGPASVLAAVGN